MNILNPNPSCSRTDYDVVHSVEIGGFGVVLVWFIFPKMPKTLLQTLPGISNSNPNPNPNP